MHLMSAQRLCDLFEAHPNQPALSWSGRCYDCQAEVEVTATPQSDGIHIVGGAVYEQMEGHFFLKCDACHRKDPVLRNFQACEVYSRVVGYLRPVAQWNDGKQAEFSLRKTFDRSLSAAADPS
ncbi:MAG: anaerobic ribonucleoside-triphosphate reductase [Desulfobacteraceae bacterium]|jgi:hypothetical protein|nr:anaerobic ribonucleoside-triphosphate reductase [Desulfobacteraceae bacterium]